MQSITLRELCRDSLTNLPELTTKEMRTHNPGSSRSRISSKFLSRDTHDRLILLSNISSLASRESDLVSSNCSEGERWCWLGANLRYPSRGFVCAHCQGHGIHSYRRTGASP